MSQRVLILGVAALLALLGLLPASGFAQLPESQTTSLAPADLAAPPMLAAQTLGFAQLSDASPNLRLAQALQWVSVPKAAVQNPDEFAAQPALYPFADYRLGMDLPTQDNRDVWLRIVMPPTPAVGQTWFLRIPRITVQRVTLYAQDTNGPWMMQTAGIAVPTARWPMRTRAPSFQLETRTDQMRVYYLKLEHRNPLVERPQLVSAAEYIELASGMGVLFGAMLGFLGLMVVIGLIALKINQDRVFAWYALFIFGVLFSQLVAMGYGGLRLWPHSAYINQIASWGTALATLASAAWFCAQASYARDVEPRADQLLMAVVAVNLVLALIFCLIPEQMPRSVLNSASVLSVVGIMGALLWIGWRSQPWVLMLALGFAPFKLAIAAYVAYSVGWLAQIEYAQIIGVIATCVSAVAIYTTLVRRNRESYSTRERAAALEITDASTGLSNARIAHVRLPALLLRSERFGAPCGVIMARWIDFADQAAQLQSHRTGAALSNLGMRLRRLVRDIDTVARLDDDTYVFLIEGPVTRESINTLTTQILTTCLRPSKALRYQRAYNMHFAMWVSGRDEIAASVVFDLLSEKLASMGSGTPRAVQFVDSASTDRADLPNHGHGDAPPISKEALVDKINAIENQRGLTG